MNTPRFDKVYCSQCGNEFGPRDAGYSRCMDHRIEWFKKYGAHVKTQKHARKIAVNNRRMDK
jgi:hypothetical protein